MFDANLPKRSGDSFKICVTMSGNVASNGYYNSLLLRQSDQIVLPILPVADGLQHAFSQPAWENFDLTEREIGTLVSPRWDSHHAHFNNCGVSYRSLSSELSALVRAKTESVTSVDKQDVQVSPETSTALTKIARQIFRVSPMREIGLLIFQVTDPLVQWFRLHGPIRKLTKNLVLMRRSHVTDFPNPQKPTPFGPGCVNWIHVSIGATRYPSRALRSKHLRHVLLEHGTIRWSHAPGSDFPDAQLRKRYKASLRNADHVWVTNLDQRTLDLAQSVCHEKWSALPHPYLLDPNAPYVPDAGFRETLLQLTNSEFVILSGSSLNLTGDQNKGIGVLLDAMSVIRNEMRLPVGLILVEWGNDIEAVRELCRTMHLETAVSFIPPMSRVRLMKSMAASDLVSDQFHFDAFGALSLRAWEQGMPVISRPISSYAATLIGMAPPVIGAASAEDVISGVASEFYSFESAGRSAYLERHLARSRGWFLDRHHHKISQKMQLQRYAELHLPHRPSALPDLWAQTSSK